MIKKIRTEAYSGSLTNGQKLRAPGMEEAHLVLKKFTCEQIKDMGLLLLVVMHTPITMSYRTGEYLFTSSCQPQIGKEETFCPDDAVWRNPNIGFVFAVA